MTTQFTISEEAIRRRTGRGWEDWFALLDGWGAAARSHAEIARWLGEQDGVDGWSAQTVAVNYERARGLRAVGEQARGGFTANVSKTVAVPVERLYGAFVDRSQRKRWLPEVQLRERTATKPKSARFDWGADTSRVSVFFESKGKDKSTVSVMHERLPGTRETERMKAFWREHLAGLKRLLEG
jgi:uncharacterized protein YndB with AHSA1/START domain